MKFRNKSLVISKKANFLLTNASFLFLFLPGSRVIYQFN